MFLIQKRVYKIHSKTGERVIDWAKSLKAEMEEMKKINEKHEKLMSDPRHIEGVYGIPSIPSGTCPQSTKESVARIVELYGER